MFASLNIGIVDGGILLSLMRCSQDNANQGVDVGDIDLAIAIHIAAVGEVVREDAVGDRIDIGNIDFAIIVHVAYNGIHANDIGEHIPRVSGLVDLQGGGGNSQRGLKKG